MQPKRRRKIGTTALRPKWHVNIMRGLSKSGGGREKAAPQKFRALISKAKEDGHNHRLERTATCRPQAHDSPSHDSFRPGSTRARGLRRALPARRRAPRRRLKTPAARTRRPEGRPPLGHTP